MGLRLTAKSQTVLYIILGILLTIFGLVWTFAAEPSGVTYKVVEGISAFAALYVIAQAAERITEWVVEGLSLLPASPEERKEEGLSQLRAANSTLNGNPTLADIGPQLIASERADLSEAVNTVVAKSAEATEEKKEGEDKVKEARRDIRFLAGGLSVALCALAVSELNYDVMNQVGAENLDADWGRLLTVFAAAGGTKALHELIGRVQKAKESKEAEAKG